MSDLRARILERIDADLELAKKATTGPWSVYDQGKDDGPEYAAHIESADPIFDWVVQGITERNDARFIAGSRSGWPAALRALREEVDVHVGFRGRAAAVSEWCDGCAESRWPCRVLLRIAKHLGVAEGPLDGEAR